MGAGRLDLADYARHQRWLSPTELVDSVPELLELAEVVVVELPRFGISSMQAADWLDIKAAIDAAIVGGVQGAVVTQGSNYIEENAFFLYLVCNPAVPVVLTAAMRPASAMGSDGGMN